MGGVGAIRALVEIALVPGERFRQRLVARIVFAQPTEEKRCLTRLTRLGKPVTLREESPLRHLAVPDIPGGVRERRQILHGRGPQCGVQPSSFGIGQNAPKVAGSHAPRPAEAGLVGARTNGRQGRSTTSASRASSGLGIGPCAAAGCLGANRFGLWRGRGRAFFGRRRRRPLGALPCRARAFGSTGGGPAIEKDFALLHIGDQPLPGFHAQPATGERPRDDDGALVELNVEHLLAGRPLDVELRADDANGVGTCFHGPAGPRAMGDMHPGMPTLEEDAAAVWTDLGHPRAGSRVEGEM